MNRLGTYIATALASASISATAHSAEAEEKPLAYTRLAAGAGVSYHTHKPQLFGGFHAKYEERRYFVDTPDVGNGGEGVFHGGVDINVLHMLGQKIDPDDLSIHAGVDIGLYSIGQKGFPFPGHIGGSVHLESHDWGAKLDIAPGDVTAEIGHKYVGILYRNVTNHLIQQDEQSIGLKGNIPLGKRFSIDVSIEGSTGHEISLQTRKYISLVLSFDIPHGEQRPHDEEEKPHDHDHNHDHD